jgi:hypothetical protein
MSASSSPARFRRALKVGGFFLAVLILPVSARTMLPENASPKLESAAPQPAAKGRTIVPRKLAGEPSGTCVRVRRKLWIEDEGWVVRAVSRC